MDDFDGRMIAAALEGAPPCVSMEPERLDLMQIDPMNNETQRYAVMSWCAATGARHVFLAGTVQAKSLVDLTEPDRAEV